MYPTGHRLIMIPPMMNFKRTLLKQFSTKISHTNPIFTSNFEAIIRQQSPIATAHHQLSGPITHPDEIAVDDPTFFEETALDDSKSFQVDPTIDSVIPTIIQEDPTR